MARENSKIPEQYKYKKIFSYSRLNTFNNCPYEYYQTYILKKPRLNNIYGVLGGYTHQLLEQLQTQTLENKEALMLFRSKVLECEILDIKFPTDAIKNNFVECIEHYLINFKPIECKSQLIELEFYTTLGETETCILGYIDLVTLNFDNSVFVYDYKTSTMYTKQALQEHEKQLLVYALALKNEYKITPKKIAFNMLKYVNIKYNNGKTEKCIKSLRNKIVETLLKNLTKELKQNNFSDIESDIILKKCLEKNSLSDLPRSLQQKFIIEDYYLECNLNTENINNLYNFIDSTIYKIQSKDVNSEDNWLPTDFSKNSFYCGTLCSFRNGNCKYYKEYIKNNLTFDVK